ncbi:MAG: FTR1 family protein [Anaerolineae bacterium]
MRTFYRFRPLWLVVMSFIFVWPALADSPVPADQLRQMAHAAAEGVAATEANNVAVMQAEYDEIHEAWETFENDIREQNPAGYVQLEGAISAVKEALQAQPLDTAAVKAAYNHLQAKATEVAEHLGKANVAEASTLGTQLQTLAHVAKEGAEAAQENNAAVMQAEYDEIHEAWKSFEDKIREQNPTAYVELEGALDAIEASLNAQPLDTAAVKRAYDHLETEANTIAEQFSGGTPLKAAVTQATPADFVKSLEETTAAINAGEPSEAKEHLEKAIQMWPSIEGTIAAKSQEAYTAIEVDLSKAMAALEAEPADLSGAAAAIERLAENAAPFVSTQTYTAFDAAAIILREGLEALLVMVALLAFLNRSGNSNKRHWIWLGGGLGVVASILAGFALQAIFSHAAAGQNREVVEGITGLVAAGMLFYVSYWLHSKSSLHAWQYYINVQTSRAIAKGSMLGLALLAFLAVFREGAETVVFYLGMAPAISWQDLWLGFGLGVVVLIVAAVLMLLVGMKLPIRPFFRIAGFLVYYLGFKFVGTGIHALQVADTLPSTPIPYLPAIPFIGFYPTWETTIPQLLLLAAAVGAFFYLKARDRRAQVAASTATA